MRYARIYPIGRCRSLALFVLVIFVAAAIGQEETTDPDGTTEAEKQRAVDSETQGLDSPPPPATPVEEKFLEWDIYWDHGVRYAARMKLVFDHYMPWSSEQEYRTLVGRIGAKVHVDAAAYRESGDLDPVPDAVDLRRARIYTRGDTYFLRPLDYRLEFGLSGGKFYFSDGYVRWHKVPSVQTIQIGQFTTPVSLEAKGSSGASTFMENASPVLALAPGKRFGIQTGGPFLDDRCTLNVRLDAKLSDTEGGDDTAQAWGPVARFTWAPVRREQDQHTELMHLGLSASRTSAGGDTFRYRARPESYPAPYLVDTGELEGDYASLFALEAAAVAGPQSLQGEYIHTSVHRNGSSALRFQGFYGQWSWFLTGESRRYNEQQGVFSRIRPNQAFSFSKGHWGAWEVCLRGSALDLSSHDIKGGRMRNLTGGLNWYWTSDTRFLLNYVFSDVDETKTTGHLHVLQARLQVEF